MENSMDMYMGSILKAGILVYTYSGRCSGIFGSKGLEGLRGG